MNTDDNGEFTLDVPAGSHVVGAASFEYVSKMFDDIVCGFCGYASGDMLTVEAGEQRPSFFAQQAADFTGCF